MQTMGNNTNQKINKKRSIKLKLVISILALVLFCTLVVGSLIHNVASFAKKPAGGNHNAQIIVINPGENLNTIAQKLYENKLISSPFKFKMVARFNKQDTSIKTGEYLLSAAMSPNTILETMVRGKVYLHKITIPEGYNLRQIAELIDQVNLADPADFVKAATDASLVREMGLDGETFEGYLFPETYFFPKETTPEQIIATMVKRFRAIFIPEWQAQAKRLGFSMHEVMTLASIIEKETGTSFERPIVSSVFHNRLKRGMRLETDPTVIYGVKNFDGNLTRKHLRTPTPYNTYLNKGLPPGPIASPGRQAIEAALYPAETSFLYFVAKKDSTHQFSTNIRDHNRAVRKYQLGK